MNPSFGPALMTRGLLHLAAARLIFFTRVFGHSAISLFLAAYFGLVIVDSVGFPLFAHF